MNIPGSTTSSEHARLQERLAEALLNWPSEDGLSIKHMARPKGRPPVAELAAAHIIAYLGLHVVPDERYCITHETIEGYCGFGNRYPPEGEHVYRSLVAIDISGGGTR